MPSGDTLVVRRPGPATTWEDVQPLVEMCGTGRLYDAERWIAQGRPVNLPQDLKPSRRRTAPLAVAIEKGFHSLVELLVRHGAETHASQSSALGLAVFCRRPDLAHLLLDLGADVRDVSFGEVLTGAWDRTLVERFIALGADTTTGDPMAYAFCRGIRPALGVYLAHRETFPQWREQASTALIHHIRAGHAKWIALLRWAGADPRVPAAQVCWPGQSEFRETPLYVAVTLGRIDLVRAFGVDPARDDLAELRWAATFSRSTAMLKYMLEVDGQPLGGLPAGAETFAAYCRQAEWSVSSTLSHSPTQTQIAEGVCELLSWGLKWDAGCTEQRQVVRRLLYVLPAESVVRIVKVLIRSHTVPMTEIQALLRTDRMQAHLHRHLNDLAAVWGDGERSAERARAYWRKKDRAIRVQTQKRAAARAERKLSLLNGPDARFVARIQKTLATKGPLPISRLARICRRSDIAEVRRLLIRMRVVGIVKCEGSGSAARWAMDGGFGTSGPF